MLSDDYDNLNLPTCSCTLYLLILEVPFRSQAQPIRGWLSSIEKRGLPAAQFSAALVMPSNLYEV